LERVSEEVGASEKLLLFNQKSNFNQLSITEATQRILNAKQALIQAFISKLETEFSLSIDAVLQVFEKVAIFVEEWLTYELDHH
jgi:hypothetical protein